MLLCVQRPSSSMTGSTACGRASGTCQRRASRRSLRPRAPCFPASRTRSRSQWALRLRRNWSSPLPLLLRQRWRRCRRRRPGSTYSWRTTWPGARSGDWASRTRRRSIAPRATTSRYKTNSALAEMCCYLLFLSVTIPLELLILRSQSPQEAIAYCLHGPRREVVPVDARDASGSTPLHEAVAAGRTHSVLALLASGSNLNAVSAQGIRYGSLSLHRSVEMFYFRLNWSTAAWICCIITLSFRPIDDALCNERLDIARVLLSVGGPAAMPERLISFLEDYLPKPSLQFAKGAQLAALFIPLLLIDTSSML